MNVIGKTGTANAPVTINGALYDNPHAWVVGTFDYEGHTYAYIINIAHGGWGEQAIDVIDLFLKDMPE